MEFRRKLKTRLYFAIGYLAIGLILTAIGFLTDTENYFFSAYGITLMIMGGIRIHQYTHTAKDDQTVRQQELKETDERNRMITERARSWAFSLFILLSGLACIVLSFLGLHDIAKPFAWAVCTLVLLYWGCYWYLQKKY